MTIRKPKPKTVDEMETGPFGLINIPPVLTEFVGIIDEGTRTYRAKGDHRAMRTWFDAICEHAGPCVSPGGAAVYAKVSRAAVYKRMKAGGLTTFCFHIIGKTKTVFGNEKRLKERPLIYIPAAECKAWGTELDKRAARIESNRGTSDGGDGSGRRRIR